jgi:hypothetical protein
MYRRHYRHRTLISVTENEEPEEVAPQITDALLLQWLEAMGVSDVLQVGTH